MNKWLRRQSRIGGILVMLTAMVGCAQIPVEEFNTYRQSVLTARESSQTVLTDLEANARYIQEQIDAAATDSTEVRRYTTPSPVGVSQAAPMTLEDRIAITVQLWSALVEYNEALAFLAEGRSEEQLKKSFGAFSTAVQSLVTATQSSIPVLAPVLGIGEQVVVQLERARGREQFKEIVTTRGKEAVAAVVAALKAEDVDADRIARTAAIGRIDKLLSTALIEYAPAIDGMVKPLKPAEKAALSGKVEQARSLLKDIAEMGLAMASEPMAKESFEANLEGIDGMFAKAFSGSEDAEKVLPSQLDQFVQSIEKTRSDALAAFNRYAAENKVIRANSALLDAVAVSMRNLSGAAMKPGDPALVASEITTLTLNLRRRWAEVEAIKSQ